MKDTCLGKMTKICRSTTLKYSGVLEVVTVVTGLFSNSTSYVRCCFGKLTVLEILLKFSNQFFLNVLSVSITHCSVIILYMYPLLSKNGFFYNSKLLVYVLKLYCYVHLALLSIFIHPLHIITTRNEQSVKDRELLLSFSLILLLSHKKFSQ